MLRPDSVQPNLIARFLSGQIGDMMKLNQTPMRFLLTFFNNSLAHRHIVKADLQYIPENHLITAMDIRGFLHLFPRFIIFIYTNIGFALQSTDLVSHDFFSESERFPNPCDVILTSGIVPSGQIIIFSAHILRNLSAFQELQ